MSRFNNFSLTVMMGAALAVFTFTHSALPQSSSPIQDFKAQGWTAYTETGKKHYPKKRYQFRIRKDEFLISPNRLRLQALLGPSDIPFQNLIDNNLANDELDSIYVTEDNFLTLAVLTNRGLGFRMKTGVRKYLLLKQVDQSIADEFRRASKF